MNGNQAIRPMEVARTLGWGLVGGLLGTLAMDAVLMGALAAAGQPPFLCFSIVGDTVAQFCSLFGVRIAGGVWAGAVTHYIVGPFVGLLFGAAAAALPALRAAAPRKQVVAAVVYVEILSQPLLATTPVLLKMTPAVTLLWYGGSFIMHLVFGVVLGAVAGCGLRPAPPAAAGKTISGSRSPIM